MEIIFIIILSVLVVALAFVALWLAQSRAQLSRQLIGAKAELAMTSTVQEMLEEAKEQMNTSFTAAAAEVVNSNNEQFLGQAREQFNNQRQLNDADLAARQQAIDSLLEPVRENLGKVETLIGNMEKERKGAFSSLEEQLRQLRDVTKDLSGVMRSSQDVGKWGELQLSRVLEMSGLKKGFQYKEKPSIQKGSTTVIPDFLVEVPNGIKVVVDAKASMNAYVDAYKTDNEEEQKELLQNLVKALNGHIETLGTKKYHSLVPGSPDFTIMFVPADSLWNTALTIEPNLWEMAFRKHRVLVATPGMLLAFLRTVAMAWQQQSLQENAQQIAEEAKEMYERLRTYADHVGKVGSGLRTAVNAYNDSVGSFDSRVHTQAKKLKDLGPAATSEPIKQPATVEEPSRSPQKVWSD